MNAQEINDKMSIDEHGTVVFDFTQGFDADDLFNVAAAASRKAAEHYRRNDPHRELREKARASVERRRVESMPGVIRHHDGVLEIPLSN